MAASCAFCCSSARTKRRMQFEGQFEQVQELFPGTDYVCLLDAETGELIAESDVAAAISEDFARTILNLKRAAMQFAASLNQMDSQTVHIKSETRMFSCYGATGTILAFYTEMDETELELFDCSIPDKRIEPIVSDLARLVQTNHRRRINSDEWS